MSSHAACQLRPVARARRRVALGRGYPGSDSGERCSYRGRVAVRIECSHAFRRMMRRALIPHDPLDFFPRRRFLQCGDRLIAVRGAGNVSASAQSAHRLGCVLWACSCLPVPLHPSDESRIARHLFRQAAASYPSAPKGGRVHGRGSGLGRQSQPRVPSGRDSGGDGVCHLIGGGGAAEVGGAELAVA
jgi:hypothetical protein